MRNSGRKTNYLKSEWFKIKQHRLFRKDIKKISRNKLGKIYTTLQSVKTKPDVLPSNTIPLKRFPNYYRTRLGSLRMIYHLDKKRKIITLLGVQSRGKAYQILKGLLS